jgi:hypothetical protein
VTPARRHHRASKKNPVCASNATGLRSTRPKPTQVARRFLPARGRAREISAGRDPAMSLRTVRHFAPVMIDRAASYSPNDSRTNGYIAISNWTALHGETCNSRACGYIPPRERNAPDDSGGTRPPCHTSSDDVGNQTKKSGQRCGNCDPVRETPGIPRQGEWPMIGTVCPSSGARPRKCARDCRDERRAAKVKGT